MPIHDVGYRAWERATGSPLLRWTVIAGAGMRLVWKNHWLRRMLILAWLPAAGLGIAVFVYEQSFEHRDLGDEMPALLGLMSDADKATAAWVIAMAGTREGLRAELDRLSRPRHRDRGHVVLAVERLMRERGLVPGSPEAHALARHQVWSLLLFTFFRYPQAVLMVLLVGLISPPLISQDFRSRAFLLYFSRPITPPEYVLGKAVVIWGFLAAVTTLPALVMYMIGVLLSPSISVVVDTWDIPLRILAASAVLLIPTTSLALFFSSLTTESRYAGFSWFAVWGLGWAAYKNLEAFDLERPWSLISLHHVMGQVQGWVFGLEGGRYPVGPAAVLLVMITVLPLIVLLTRVAAPMRV